MHLATLQQGDRLSVPDHRDDEFPQPCMAAVTQRLAVAASGEEFRLVTHAAQGRPAGESI